MPHAVRSITFSLVAAASLVCLGPSRGAAQKPDTVRPMASMASIPRDSLVPPISPGRAFLYSFLVPGSGQSILRRHKAATALLLVESISLVMIRESAADVHEARRFENDTTVLTYVDASGKPFVDAEGNFAPRTADPRFGPAYVRTRRAHVEDWIALLVANHLFAGADAFVAAHLWDVKARLALQSTSNGTALVASIPFP
jgi:hypothetical protein